MVPATKRERSSESEVPWTVGAREGEVVLRPEREGRRGLESSGRMRVLAWESPGTAPHAGHDSASPSISRVQAGHLIARGVSLGRGCQVRRSSPNHALTYEKPRRKVYRRGFFSRPVLGATQGRRLPARLAVAAAAAAAAAAATTAEAAAAATAAAAAEAATAAAAAAEAAATAAAAPILARARLV